MVLSFCYNLVNVLSISYKNYSEDEKTILGQTASLKQRIRKHKSDVFHPQNSFCKKCSERLRNCRRMKEPFFRIYPFLYENEKELCVFKEKRFIMRWKPQFNTYQ